METNIMEHTTIKKEELQKVEFEFFKTKEDYFAKNAINLLTISSEERKELYLFRAKELSKKEADLYHLTGKLAFFEKKSNLLSKDIEEITSLKGKIDSIGKTKVRLEKELSLICKANMMFTISTVASPPIGEESIEDQLNDIINNHIGVYEAKMYEVLCCNSSDVVIPVLDKILERHGYKVTKIRAKKLEPINEL